MPSSGTSPLRINIFSKPWSNLLDVRHNEIYLRVRSARRALRQVPVWKLSCGCVITPTRNSPGNFLFPNTCVVGKYGIPFWAEASRGVTKCNTTMTEVYHGRSQATSATIIAKKTTRSLDSFFFSWCHIAATFSQSWQCVPNSTSLQTQQLVAIFLHLQALCTATSAPKRPNAL